MDSAWIKREPSALPIDVADDGITSDLLSLFPGTAILNFTERYLQ